jgi:Transglycosylase SLT domain
MTPRTFVVAAALASVGRFAAAAQADCSSLRGAQAPDDPRLREWLRRLIREVARKEGVDPIALEALGMVETELRPMVGRACEIGPFQVMPSWAEVFRLDSVALLWDPRINAIAAARIYKAAWQRWDPRFAQAGRNRALQAAGWRGHSLDRESFAALAYNWGRAPLRFARASDLREVVIPASSAAYAVRFNRALREGRQRAQAAAQRGRG